VALPGFHDTQCGFKCWTARAAESLFAQQTLYGWAFDVEILFIARQWGYKVVELPVPWYFNPDSKVNVLRDSYQMAADLLRIRLNDIQGRYHAEI
jgi:dolichyl-phosphate beta-glucosyltransferase